MKHMKLRVKLASELIAKGRALASKAMVQLENCDYELAATLSDRALNYHQVADWLIGEGSL